MTYKTPGVYITEVDAFGPSIVGVATAEAAFVGYTETARDPATGTRIDAPISLGSLVEYQTYFGGPAKPNYRVEQTLSATPAFTAAMTMPDGTVVSTGFDVTRTTVAGGANRFCLYSQVELFFANGGSACRVVSAGSHAGPAATITANGLLAGIDAMGKVAGPSMLVVPEAGQLPQPDYARVVCAMLDQAGSLRDRVAILDLPGCLDATDSAALTVAQQNLWRAIAPQADNFSYGAAYGPALATTVFQPSDVGFSVLAGSDNRTINVILTTQAVQLYHDSALAGVQAAIAAAFPVAGVTTNTSLLSGDASAYRAPAQPGADGLAVWQQHLDDLLKGALPMYVDICQRIADDLNVQPASGAIAGVWAGNDAERGVWNAPANIALARVDAPLCPINDTEQEAFNVPLNGMAVDIIRAFPARGVLVWGARTLDGNSQDHRYVQVRRTLIYVEQSIKLGLQHYASAANDSATWITVISTVSNFLTRLWEEGGLLGATPAEAFTVQCGVGTTMSGVDLLTGNMVVAVMLQMVRPAEFIELTFRQAMRTD